MRRGISCGPSWIAWLLLRRFLWTAILWVFGPGLFGIPATGLYYVVFWVLYVLIAMLMGPFVPIILTLIYYDQRVRQEGLDIELLMSAAGMDVAPVVAEGDPTDSALGTSEPLV